jgi:hypothetical protein
MRKGSFPLRLQASLRLKPDGESSFPAPDGISLVPRYAVAQSPSRHAHSRGRDPYDVAILMDAFSVFIGSQTDP